MARTTSTAKDNPAILSPTLEAAEQQIGQNTELLMPATGTLDNMVRTDQEIQAVPGPNWEDKAARLAFYEEKMEVMVHETTDKNASPLVDVYVNGIPQRFIRGHAIVVKRKFVSQLARAKPIGIETTITYDNKGEPVNRVGRTAALAYPFSVIRDDNPKGPAWLKKILAEA